MEWNGFSDVAGVADPGLSAEGGTGLSEASYNGAPGASLTTSR